MPVTTYTSLNGEILSEKRDGVRRDYVPDPLGSTVALLDQNGTKTDTWVYWPYGEVRTRTGNTATPFQFVGSLGYYRDSTTRTYVRARHYQQGLGRWATVDPVWPRGAAYTYVASSPVRGADPSGRDILKDIWDFLFGPKIDPIHGTPKPGVDPILGFPEKPVCVSGKLCFELPPPVYGNYCGPQGRCIFTPRPGPENHLDKCCQAHDDCWSRQAPPCNWYNQVARSECQDCTHILCTCAKETKCYHDSACVKFRKYVLKLYCRWPFL